MNNYLWNWYLWLCPIIVALQTHREVNAPFLLESHFFVKHWHAVELWSFVVLAGSSWYSGKEILPHLWTEILFDMLF